MKKHLSIALSAVACTTLLLAGCGTEPSTRESSNPSMQADVGVLAEALGSGVNEIDVGDSPAEFAAIEPVALTGTLKDIAPGLTVAAPDGSGKYETRWEHAIVRVRIDHVYKSQGVDLDGEFAYVAVPLGGQATDLAGEPLGDGPSTIMPISDLQEGLPSGTRVVIVADLFPDAHYGEKHLNADAGAEPGAQLLRGISPHSFSAEDGATRRLSGWDSTTYDEAVAGLQKAFS